MASVGFEQSYGEVEGDSASVAELLALLSAISNIPLKQNLAVTGSINQLGEVQVIGGVNEKIEGFFDICAERGLTGDQGVVIPTANAKHLMLKKEVVDAAADGKFHIYAVNNIDEAIELFSGMPAGKRGDDDQLPENTFNYAVELQLLVMAELVQPPEHGTPHGHDNQPSASMSSDSPQAE
jgi:predicted ATP-dependent protease